MGKQLATALQSYLFALFVGALFVLSAVARADAQTTGSTIQIDPAFQHITITETQLSTTSAIVVTNQSPVDQTFHVFAVDVQQFDADGKVILADKPIAGSQYQLAEFVRFEKSEWTIPAKQQQTIPFSILNSQQLSPGGHYAAVVVRLVAAAQTSQQQILPAVSSFLLVRKQGGENYHLSLQGVPQLRSWLWWQAPEKIQLLFSNQGNVHVAPRGLVTLQTIGGEILYRGIINDNSLEVFPSTQRTIPITLRREKGIWPVQLMRVSITGRSEPGEIPFQQSTIVLVVAPWLAVMMLLSVGLALWRYRLYLRSRLNSNTSRIPSINKPREHDSVVYVQKDFSRRR